MKRRDKAFLINQLLVFVLTIWLCSCQTKTESNQSIVDKQVEDPIPPPPYDTSMLKEEVLMDYIRAARTIKPNLKNGVPFEKLDYDKIIAYDFAGSEEPYPSVIGENGKFVPVIRGQKALNQEQADEILSTLTKNSTYGETTAGCFRPHFALVFFKNNEKVNQISVCLDCNYLSSDIKIPAETHHVVNKGTKEEYVLIGFTDSGVSAIKGLCKELDFYYGRTESKELE